MNTELYIIGSLSEYPTVDLCIDKFTNNLYILLIERTSICNLVYAFDTNINEICKFLNKEINIGDLIHNKPIYLQHKCENNISSFILIHNSNNKFDSYYTDTYADESTDDVWIKTVFNRIKNSKSLDPEFNKIINDNFWNLI